MKKHLSILSTTLGLSILAAGCGEGDASTNTDNIANNENGAAEASEMTIEHASGETAVPNDPENVIVFDFGVLDTLRELDIDPIAVPKGSPIPSYLAEFEDDRYTNAGTLFEPDFETIYGLDPDLIIISGRTVDAYDELNEIAPTIHIEVDATNYVESFKENTETLAQIFGKTDEVDDMLAEIDESIASLNEANINNEETGLIVMASEGTLSAYGPGSRFGLIHEEFGVHAADKNIDEANHGQNVSFEYVVETNPDYLYVIDRGAVVSDGDDTTAKETIENSLVEKTKAYQEGNIIYLTPDYWYLSAGGLSSVAEMVKEMKESIK